MASTPLRFAETPSSAYAIVILGWIDSFFSVIHFLFLGVVVAL